MRMLCAVLVCLSASSAAYAMSNMEQTVRRDMQKAGMPEDCIAKVTRNDATRITRLKNSPGDSEANANRQIKNQYRKICER